MSGIDHHQAQQGIGSDLIRHDPDREGDVMAEWAARDLLRDANDVLGRPQSKGDAGIGLPAPDLKQLGQPFPEWEPHD